LNHAKEQVQLIEADEATTMCDAGLERARQAMAVYRLAKPAPPQLPWTLNQVLKYCSNNYNTMYINYCNRYNLPIVPVDATQPPNPLVIKNDFMNQKNSLWYQYYNNNLWGANGSLWGLNPQMDVPTPGTPISVDGITPIPPSTTTYPSGDPGANVALGWNVPFHKGAIHIHVRNNADGGGPFSDTDSTILVTVTATLPSGIQRQIDGTVNWPPPAPAGAQFKALGAVVANDSVNTNGHTTIDGRDYGYDPKTGATGTLTGSPGVFGVVSDNNIAVGGASGVGGNGSAPATGGSVGSTNPNFVYPGGYPPSPDVLMGQPPGTLKATAQAQGTYCASATDYANLLAANGGKLPDQAIIYLDFTPGSGVFELGSGNTRSSILVVHTDTYTGTISEVHGTFTGAVFADAVVRVNAGTSITGMVQLFSPTSSSAGNVLGNGDSTIHFSNAALNDLPAANPGPPSGLPLTSSRRLF
ncbi:MAG TPA: hypothetical protein VMU54_21145, partial [Planctomycetota bacterium]|nr:hypothetical protein [Planctomycetota bacterium]